MAWQPIPRARTRAGGHTLSIPLTPGSPRQLIRWNSTTLVPKVNTPGIPTSSPRRPIPAGTATHPPTGFATAPNGEIRGEEEAQVEAQLIPLLAEVAIKVAAEALAAVAPVGATPMGMAVAAAEGGNGGPGGNGNGNGNGGRGVQSAAGTHPKTTPPGPGEPERKQFQGQWLEWCRKCGSCRVLGGIPQHRNTSRPSEIKALPPQGERTLQPKPIMSWWRILKLGMCLMLLVPRLGVRSLLLCLLCYFVFW